MGVAIVAAAETAKRAGLDRVELLQLDVFELESGPYRQNFMCIWLVRNVTHSILFKRRAETEWYLLGIVWRYFAVVS